MSKPVTSNQEGMHEGVASLVQKHLKSSYQKPLQAHNLVAFESILEKIEQVPHRSLILDSCCGTGMSTCLLAMNHPDSLVIGIDQSDYRLNKKSDKRPKNAALVQANCEDIWRLCVDHDIYFDAHYILYPNPWPKKSQLKRRWHGHPVFPSLKLLAGKTILRSNWKVYLDEFNLAWTQLPGCKKSEVSLVSIWQPLSLFEKKYAASGQCLYELVVAVN